MNEKNDNQEKIISLYKFLSEFCKLKYKIITNDNNYPWICQISNIPLDPENISIEYSDVTEDDDELEEKNNYLLKVHKPEFQKCPEAPDIIKEWLQDGWNDYKKEEVNEVIREKNEYTNALGELIIEYFNDSDERKNQFEEWLENRKKWIEKQKKIERTRNLFTSLYLQYIDLQRDSEILEIIIANGYIKDSQDSSIYHPVLTKRLSINFNANENTIYLQNTNARAELYTELFQIMKDINLDSLSELNSELMQNDYHPMDRNNTKVFLKALIRRLSSDSKFVEDDIDTNSRLQMFFRPTIIVRKKIDGTVKIIEQIIKNIEENGFIPQHLLDLVNGGLMEKTEESEEDLDELLAKAGGESIDILLTKEANKEQLEIAKRIENYNAVLVQGPPGTGKTHTIANLLGHFLAKGKSVLVTSYTNKALTVLKEKLPINMQSLCVSVLDESNNDMENSIDGITEYMSNHTSFELSKQVNILKENRLQIINELSETRKKIYQILNKEYKNIVLNGEEISPSDAAKYVLENRDTLNYIRGSVRLYSPLPLPIDELNYLYSTNANINVDDEKELNYNLPNPNTLINPLDFKEKIVKNKEIINFINSIASKDHWEINYDNSLSFNTNFGQFNVTNLDEISLNRLKKFLLEFKNYATWSREICCDGKRGGVYTIKWTTLIKKIEDTINIREYILGNHYDKKITGQLDSLSDESISKLKSILNKKGKISFINLLFNSDLKEILNLKLINNKSIETVDDCDFILKTIEMYNSRKSLSEDWDELMSKNGLPSFYELDSIEPEMVAQKYINDINKCLNWYTNDYNELIELLEKNSIPSSIVLKTNNLDRDIDQINKIFNVIQNILPNIVQICLYKLEYDNNLKSINTTIDILQSISLNSTISAEALNNIINNDYEQYLENYKKLEEIYSKYEILNIRNEYLSKIEEVAPLWANDIRNRFEIHGESSCPSNIYDAWKYKQYEQILDELMKDTPEELYKKSQRLSLEYRQLTEEYAEKCAWFELLSRTELDIDMKQSLKGWELTVKKIGKGTGKNVSMYKEKARNLMAKCQKAVPCWIMPINKAIESLQVGENQFDIIIIDEASQSDISALAIAFFGKKMIVVGDDNQVSPMSVGIELENINALEKIYLKNKIPNSHLYTSKTSLYDISATTFQPLMLNEHFRCVPEIIGFSNMLSYNYKIKPLRDAESSNLFPAIINYRVDGKRDEKTNIIEAQTIISLMKSCIELEEYNGKSFGVISLLGEAQYKLIESLMIKYINPRDIEKHNITIGIASKFQGDERDVIFISMVDSPNENGNPLSLVTVGVEGSIKKRYNVAVSRAKDQLWIVNSLDETCLKSGDMRKLLLDYAKTPDAFSIKEKEIKNKSESIFEMQVASMLVSSGYHIKQQYSVGSYRLDIVVLCGKKKVVIECDGDRYHSGEEKIREDMQRQVILERIGWKFIRISGSQFFRNPDEQMKKVINKLNDMGIFPENEYSVSNNRTSDLLEKVKKGSQKYLDEIKKESENKVNSEDVLYALDTNIQKNVLDEINNRKDEHYKEENE